MADYENILDMPDEEFLKNPPPLKEEEPDEGTTVPENEDQSDGTSQEHGEETDQGGTEDLVDEEHEGVLGLDSEGHSEGSEGGGDSDDTDTTGSVVVSTDSGNETEDEGNKETESRTSEEDGKEVSGVAEEKKTEELDYKALYEQIMKPFKANGKMITPQSPEDVITLMQMGANYNKKMRSLKAGLKVLKTLEKNEIDPDTLNFLIDIKNKKPEAIKKLLHDAKIDPMELDLPEEGKDINYNPTDHSASEVEVEFANVLDDIKDSPEFPTTQKIVTDIWDEPSRLEIYQNPKLLKLLHEEVELGRFEKVQKIIDSERALGKLEGVSDLQAYIAIVKQLVANEGQQQTQSKPKAQTKPKPKPTGNKEAAKPTRQTKPKQEKKASQYTPEEILEMDDEEFMKRFKPNLM
jgi:hypothetical protein